MGRCLDENQEAITMSIVHSSTRAKKTIVALTSLYVCIGFICIGFVASGTAQAVITRLTPLAEVLETEHYIFVARVTRLDAGKPLAVFQVVRALKGELPFQQLAVNMSGDDEAKKANDTQTILDRLDSRRQVVFFVSKRGKRYQAMAFVEGSWFSLQGFEEDAGKAVRWAFLHGEPYLRRTFAGSSAELIRIIEDGLAKRAAPPRPDEKAKPGYGPPASEDKPDKSAGSGARLGPRWLGGSARGTTLWAVIPSFVLVGPLAILAAIFPGLFARLAVAWKRWRAFLTVASLNSTLALIHYFAQDYLPQGWWWGLQAWTVYLLVITLMGLLWAGIRYRRLASLDPLVTAVPSRVEVFSLAGMSLFATLCILFTICWADVRTAILPPMREFTCIGLGVIASLLYAIYRRSTALWDGNVDEAPGRRLSLSGESVALGTLVMCLLIASVWYSSYTPSPWAVTTESREGSSVIGPRLVSAEALEIYEQDGNQRVVLRGQVLSRVVVDQGRLYFGIMEAGLSGGGRIVCADSNGKVIWSYDGDEKPCLPVYCTPVVVNGVVYCGEGLHEHSNCRLFALDALTGQPRWPQPFRTSSHTEGSPIASQGLVVFPAGDDGVYAVGIEDGKIRWHLRGGPESGLHVDGAPAIANGRLYLGSGLYSTVALCLDLTTGQQLWRTDLKLRSFAAPLVLGERVYYGVGTGNLGADTYEYPEEKGERKEKQPAGAVVCLDATTGKEIWRSELPRGVHAGLVGDAFQVYATCRDGSIYAFDRHTGQQRWRVSVGSAITSQAGVAKSGGMPVAVYAVSREGLVVCIHPQTGQVIWHQPLPGFFWDGQETSGVLGGPTILQEVLPQASRRTIYIGAMTVDPNNPNRRQVAVFRLMDELTEP